MIAKHVMNIHMNRPNNSADENGEVVGEIDIDKMKRYISYCKAYVFAQEPCCEAAHEVNIGNARRVCLLTRRRC